jgi:hypothetical protein
MANTILNLNNSTPAAPGGNTNVTWQFDTSNPINVSGYVPASASPAWSSLQNAVSNLTLANAAYSTSFNQTSSVIWTWANVTPATSSIDQSSPIHNLAGRYWNGSASATDTWGLQNFLYEGYVYTLTAVANAAAGHATYTVSGTNQYPLPPVNATVTVAGFVNGVNNGTFTVISGSQNSLTLANASSTAESASATALVATMPSSSDALVFTHSGTTRSQILIPSTLAGTYPDLGFALDASSGIGYIGSSQVEIWAGGVIFGFSSSSFNVAGVGNIVFANNAAGILSVKADPTSTYTLTAAFNASGGNTTYTGTFSPTIPVGAVIGVSGFVNSGNNFSYGVVISCNATTLVVVNNNGIAETHSGQATTVNPSIFFGPGGSTSNGFTATAGLPPIAYDPPVNNSWGASQAGRVWFNTSTKQLKVWDGVETQILPGLVAKSNLTAQAAAITATTIWAVPAGLGGMYEVSWSATVTTADGVSSTLGGAAGFQLKYTNLNDSVVKTTNPTTVTVSAGNTTGTSIGGVFTAYCKASTNLQYLFGYTSNTPGQMIYDLNIYVKFIG